MAFTQKTIGFVLSDALRRYTEDFQLLTNTNPYRLKMNGRNYSIHASEIHDSGVGRQDDDEWRIQLQANGKKTQAARNAQGDVVLFLGFFPPRGEVFSAWEPDYILSLSTEGTGTVYVPHSHEELVLRKGAAIDVAEARKLHTDTAKVSLPVEALGFYLENWRVLHSARTDADLLKVVGPMSDAIDTAERTGKAKAEVEVAGQKRIVTTTRTSYARDPKFSRDVLKAYLGKCCICDRQLGLVEAAHIVPHGHPDGLDHVTNGLALCVEHHRLYDSQLLLPTSGRQLYLNPDRVEHLRNIGQDSGLDEIEALAAGQYRVPDHVPSRPSDDYLERGVRIRLGIDA